MSYKPWITRNLLYFALLLSGLSHVIINQIIEIITLWIFLCTGTVFPDTSSVSGPFGRSHPRGWVHTREVLVYFLLEVINYFIILLLHVGYCNMWETGLSFSFLLTLYVVLSIVCFSCMTFVFHCNKNLYLLSIVADVSFLVLVWTIFYNLCILGEQMETVDLLIFRLVEFTVIVFNFKS